MRAIVTNINHPHFPKRGSARVRELRNRRLLIVSRGKSYVFQFDRKSEVMDRLIYSHRSGAYIGLKK